MNALFAGFIGDLGSLCTLFIVGMVLLIVLVGKMTPAKTQGQVAASGIEALLRKLFGGK